MARPCGRFRGAQLNHDASVTGAVSSHAITAVGERVVHLQPAEVGFVVWRLGGVKPEFHGQVFDTDLVGVVVLVVLVFAKLAPVALVGRNKIFGIVGRSRIEWRRWVRGEGGWDRL